MKKNLVMFTSVFASLAILSTGFAAWVISGGDTNEDKIGDIIVDKIEDQRHIIQKVECVDTANKGKIIFGHPEDATATDKWLKNDNPDTVEKLVTVFKVTVLNAANATVGSIFADTCSVTATTNADKFASAVTKGYVSELPTVKFVSSATATDNADKLAAEGSIFVRLEFKWGSKFTKEGLGANLNPYKYYNSFTVTEKGDEANTVLGEMNTMLTGVQFKLKLVTKA